MKRLLMGALFVVGLMVVSVNSAHAQAPTTSLVGYWSLNEGSGSTAADTSGYSHNGTLQSSPTWIDAKIGKGLLFSSNYVSVGNIPQINNITKLTATAWVKRTAAGSIVVLGKKTNGNDVGIDLRADGKLYFDLSNGSTANGSFALNDTSWHHIALVFDGTLTGNSNRLKGYVDGTQRTLTFSGTVPAATTNNTAAFNIGRLQSTNSAGSIDEVRLYARALSGSEILDVMNDAPAPNVTFTATPNVIAYNGTTQLQWNTTYADSCVASNGWSGNVATSGVQTVANMTATTVFTLTCTGAGGVTAKSATTTVDATAPVVSITAPANNASVYGNVTLNATASDNGSVAGVQFKLDGANIGSEITVAPYSVTWNAGSASLGTHTISATARDSVGNTNSASISVTVITQPSQFAQDSFTGTDATALSSHTPELGGSWTETAAVGTLKLLSNKLETTNFTRGTALTAAVPSSADYDVSADITMNVTGWGNKAGVQGRFAGSFQTGYQAYYDESVGQWVLEKWVGYNVTTLGTYAQSFPVGTTKTVKLRMSGSTITVFVDGTQVISVTDTSITTTNNPGVFNMGGIHDGMLVDNFLVEALQAAPGDTIPPSAPSNLTASIQNNSAILLTWGASTDTVGVTGYTIWKNNALLATTNSLSYVDGNVAINTPYSYYVVAADAAGNLSSQSNTVSTTILVLPTITAFTASPTTINASNQSRLSWSTSNATSLSIDQGVGAVTGITSTSVAPAITTKYTLTATNAAGSVSASTTVTVNQAPSVATPAAASPASVSGNSSALSALGADDGGESALTYTWSIVSKPAGAANPVFSSNGTNTSKNATVSFAAAGNYQFLVTIADTMGLNTTSTVAVTVLQTATSLTVSPTSSVIQVNTSQQFSANCYDQFGATINGSNISWSVVGSGSVNSSGLYTAPATSGTDNVRASCGSVVTAAVVTVNQVAPPQITSFTATPSTTNVGGFTVLAWSVSNTTSLSINQGIGAVSGSSITTTPSFTTTYTLTATNGGGTSTAQVTVLVNQVPTVASPAIASPSTVIGTTTTLSVLGADDAGEANLTYTWSVLSQPAGANTTFTVNNTNAAKNTTVTFTKAGSYQFRATIKDSRNLTVTSDVATVVNQTLNYISLSPTSSLVQVNNSSQFVASAYDQFGVVITPSPAFTWSVLNGGAGGTVNSNGLYTAPATVGSGTDFVQAASGGLYGIAGITVIPAPLPTITSFTATPSTIPAGTSATLAWSVNNATSLSINQGVGTVTGQSNVSVLPTSTKTYTLTATNASGSATSTVTVTVTAAADPSLGCGIGGQPTGDFHLSTTDGNGTTRDYEVIVPANYNPSVPLSLSFVYHEAGGSEASAKFWGLQNAPGATSTSIFVFPQGINYQSYGIGWNDSCSGYDMPYFDNMINAIQNNYCIDKKKVFVSGFSWGCDQALAVSSCRGNKVRAAALGSCTDEFSDPNVYTSYANYPVPTPVNTAFRLTHDVNGDIYYSLRMFQSTAQLLRSYNNCEPAVTSTPAGPNCVAYSSCTNQVVECSYSGLGHALPATWAADTWNFFKSL